MYYLKLSISRDEGIGYRLDRVFIEGIEYPYISVCNYHKLKEKHYIDIHKNFKKYIIEKQRHVEIYMEDSENFREEMVSFFKNYIERYYKYIKYYIVKYRLSEKSIFVENITTTYSELMLDWEGDDYLYKFKVEGYDIISYISDHGWYMEEFLDTLSTYKIIYKLNSSWENEIYTGKYVIDMPIVVNPREYYNYKKIIEYFNNTVSTYIKNTDIREINYNLELHKIFIKKEKMN